LLPLGLYLLSFVIAFAGRRGPPDFITVLAPLVILIAGGLAFSSGTQQPALLGDARPAAAVRDRGRAPFGAVPAAPGGRHLTRFYLAMSVGGMLGGLFCAIIAPLLFDWAYEHPMLVLAAALLVPQYVLCPGRRRWTPGCRSPAALACILSFATERALIGDSATAEDVLASSVSLLALACLGRRWPFACAGRLMLSYDGWRTIVPSRAATAPAPISAFTRSASATTERRAC
jgi:hypothetical protein